MIFRRAGFTVIELMITVAVIAVLITIAAPSLRDLILNARMTGLANNFMTDLAIARSEAVKRGTPTAMCPSNRATQCSAAPYTGCACTATAWNQGWVIFQDANGNGTIDAPATEVIKYVPAIDGANETQPSTIREPLSLAALRFLSSGMSVQGGAGTVVFHMCDSRSQAYGTTAAVAGNKGRKITILGSGRASATRCTCDTNNLCP